jgi:hypothetical protein
MLRGLFAFISPVVALEIAGCALPYAFLFQDQTPALRVIDVARETRAFRAEYRATRCSCSDQFEPVDDLSVVDLIGDPPRLPSQSRLSFAAGVISWTPPLSHDFGENDRVDVRLYRPGFKTVIINRNWQQEAVKWESTKSPEDRETAIDMVFLSSPFGRYLRQPVSGPVAVKRCAPEILHWGVSEYERLSNLDEIPLGARERLAGKASFLRRCDQR